jgi:hypothetical protein
LFRTDENRIFLLDVEKPFKKAALVRETSLQTSVLMVLAEGVSEKELPTYKAFKGLVETVNSKVEVG